MHHKVTNIARVSILPFILLIMYICQNNNLKDKRKRPYLPHRLCSPKKVQKRNARERERSNEISRQFLKLRNLLPYVKKTRVAKEDILKLATEYIKQLQHMIEVHDAQQFVLPENEECLESAQTIDIQAICNNEEVEVCESDWSNRIPNLLCCVDPPSDNSIQSIDR